MRAYHWEWEALTQVGGPRSLAHGTVVSRSQTLVDDEWQRIAVPWVEVTVAGLLPWNRNPLSLTASSSALTRGCKQNLLAVIGMW